MQQSNKTSKAVKKENLKKSFSDAYVIIGIIIVICAILTYVIPAGTYDRVLNEASGKTVVDPTSFQFIENTPANLLDVFRAVPKGLVNMANIVFTILICGGAFEVFAQTGCTSAFLGANVKKFQDKEWLLFPIVVIILSALAATVGVAEEAMIFVPILAALVKPMGGDIMVAIGLAYCGLRAGHINGMMNAFSLGTAQSIAELPLYSGIGYRSIWYVITVIVTTVIIYRYHMKIKKDPTKSIVYNPNAKDENEEADFSEIPEFDTKRKIIGLMFVGLIVLMIYGIFQYGWYITEVTALFLAFGIIVGVIAGFPAHEIVQKFAHGAKNIVYGGLIAGVAGGILVVLQNGQILDTIIYYVAGWLENVPSLVAVNGMYVFQWVLNIVIPSGSGQAAATMPLLIPICDLLEINRQVAVTAFHYGDGVTNILTPTSGALMACLAVGKVSWVQWVKWVIPMLVAWSLIGFASVTIAHLINFGPF